MSDKARAGKPCEFKRWTNPTGDEWVCAATDHGPFCRLCQRVDINPRLALLLDNVRRGSLMVVGCDSTGDLLFSMTERGNRLVKNMGHPRCGCPTLADGRCKRRGIWYVGVRRRFGPYCKFHATERLRAGQRIVRASSPVAALSVVPEQTQP
jgi:hypothetical protein